jgi:hypothetical protein
VVKTYCYTLVLSPSSHPCLSTILDPTSPENLAG